MLPLTLNNNEIKDSAGVEIEFQRFGTDIGRKLEFFKIGENPAYPHRLGISHQERGAGIRLRRRSQCWVKLTHLSSVDNVTPVTSLIYQIADLPVGAISSYAVPLSLNANLLSFMASKGASTTILYDGTGYGSEALINGSL